MPAKQPRRPARLRLLPWLQAGAIVVVAVASQAASIPGRFVWDDEAVIAGNLRMRSAAGLREFWTSTSQGDYWPIAYSTHWVEWQLFGDRVAGYRATNIALHVANALLVWVILARLGIPGGWLAALLFAAHPVTVEAVAWILQRKTLLSTTFALVCLWFWLRSAGQPRDRRYWLALACHVAGMLTKSAVVTWPATLLLARWWQNRRLTWPDVRATIPFWLASAGLGAVGMWFQQYRAIGQEIVRDDGLLSRLAIAGRAICFYAEKALVPDQLCFVYPRWPLKDTTPAAFLPLIGVLAVWFVAWWYRAGRGRPFVFAISYYVFNLLPALGLVNIYFMRYSLVADHWQYLALPAPLALVAGGIVMLRDRLDGAWRSAMNVAAGALVVLLAALSIRQASTFYSGDAMQLWRATLAHNPAASLAHANLSGLLLEQGDLAGARRESEAALRYSPRHAEPETALAIISLLEGHFDEAEEHCRRALEFNPAYDLAREQVGLLKALNGDADAARTLTPAALGHPERQAAWQARLGRVLSDLGRHQEAADVLTVALQDKPDSAALHAMLAKCLWQLRDFSGAQREFMASLHLMPDNLDTANSLAYLLATRRNELQADPIEAVRLGEMVVARSKLPNASYWDTLAVAYATAGNFKRATEAITRTIALVPAQDSKQKDDFQAKLDLFKQGIPFTEPKR